MLVLVRTYGGGARELVNNAKRSREVEGVMAMPLPSFQLTQPDTAPACVYPPNIPDTRQKTRYVSVTSETLNRI